MENTLLFFLFILYKKIIHKVPVVIVVYFYILFLSFPFLPLPFLLRFFFPSFFFNLSFQGRGIKKKTASFLLPFLPPPFFSFYASCRVFSIYSFLLLPSSTFVPFILLLCSSYVPLMLVQVLFLPFFFFLPRLIIPSFLSFLLPSFFPFFCFFQSSVDLKINKNKYYKSLYFFLFILSYKFCVLNISWTGNF